MVKEYQTLEVISYSDKEKAEKEYEKRFNSDNAHHIGVTIKGNPAFFVETPIISRMLADIYKLDKIAYKYARELPRLAKKQFTDRCLIDEIVLTNDIEGVVSSRVEIREALGIIFENDKKLRFRGLVQKYTLLQKSQEINLRTPQDIRDIYDELVLQEVLESDPKNMPDGKIFRKDSVSVFSPRQTVLHYGLTPESNIIDTMEKTLEYFNDETEAPLYRAAVLHYLIGYIHPFYDGNGRLNRFISSYVISKELEPLLSYRFSYTVKEHISKYYNAFKDCNEPKNKGELTSFVEMFLEMLIESLGSLIHALQERYEKLVFYKSNMKILPGCEEEYMQDIYFVLIQASLYAEHGVSTQEMIQTVGKTRETLRKRLGVISQFGWLYSEKIGRDNYYHLDIDKLEQYITEAKEKSGE